MRRQLFNFVLVIEYGTQEHLEPWVDDLTDNTPNTQKGRPQRFATDGKADPRMEEAGSDGEWGSNSVGERTRTRTMGKR